MDINKDDFYQFGKYDESLYDFGQIYDLTQNIFDFEHAKHRNDEPDVLKAVHQKKDSIHVEEIKKIKKCEWKKDDATMDIP